MVDPLVLGMTATNLQELGQSAPNPSLLTSAFKYVISFAAVKGLFGIGRRKVMAEALPDDTTHINPQDTVQERDYRAVGHWALLYTIGLGLTGTAVWLTMGLETALAYVGVGAFVASAIALYAARDKYPVDDIRLLLASRQTGGADD